jgi:hypothetical protein
MEGLAGEHRIGVRVSQVGAQHAAPSCAPNKVSTNVTARLGFPTRVGGTVRDCDPARANMVLPTRVGGDGAGL